MSKHGLTQALALLLFCHQAVAGNYTLTTIADNLNNPWSIAFLPGGSMLVTERIGQLRTLAEDGTVGEPITGVPDVLFRGQGGLFDVLPDPEFASNRIVYLSYASGDMKANATRIARARFTGSALEDLEVIFEVSPAKQLPQHFGGRMVFMADGTLLLTTGDGFDFREQAQNPAVTLGKTIRVNRDGSIPPDNPFANGVDGHPAVWTYGHRNPQGLAIDPLTGRVYQHEHGPKGGDEINVLEPGANYGWPAITYGDDYSGAKVSPFTSLPGMQQPLMFWVPSIAPCGLTVYRGTQFPEWSGSLLVGALVDKEVRRVSMSAAGEPQEETLFSEVGERIRDVRTAPDGAVYLLTDGNPGKVIRVTAAR